MLGFPLRHGIGSTPKDQPIQLAHSKEQTGAQRDASRGGNRAGRPWNWVGLPDLGQQSAPIVAHFPTPAPVDHTPAE